MSTPTGTRGLTNAERAERNRAIAEAHLGGATWEQVAERFGVSKATARRAAAEHGESVARLQKGELVPVGRVDVEALLALGVRANELALRRGIALLYAADNPNTQVGAMNAVARVLSSIGLTLVRVGAVADPRDDVLRRQVDAAASEIGRVFLEMARDAGVPDEVIDEVLRPSSEVERRALTAARAAW